MTWVIGAKSLTGSTGHSCTCRIDREGREGHEQGIAVRLGFCDRLDSDHGAGARAVVDDYRPAEPLREPGRDDAGGDVGAAPGGRGHDDAHRLRWTAGLRERGNAAGSAGPRYADEYRASYVRILLG